VKFAPVLKPQEFRILFLILFLCSPNLYADDQKGQRVLRLNEGENGFVSGSEIKIFVKSVIDRTSSGCMGGPIGCRDQVTIEIQSGENTSVVVLEPAKTPDQKARKIDQTSIHGRTIRLIRLSKKEVEFVVEDFLKDERDH
jgi:hypothetical protein